MALAIISISCFLLMHYAAMQSSDTELTKGLSMSAEAQASHFSANVKKEEDTIRRAALKDYKVEFTLYSEIFCLLPLTLKVEFVNSSINLL